MDENLAKIRHERSKKDFPMLTLEDDEYVEYAFKRASVCLMLIMAGIGIGVIIILLGLWRLKHIEVIDCLLRIRE